MEFIFAYLAGLLTLINPDDDLVRGDPFGACACGAI